jgi:hypothetical protein
MGDTRNLSDPPKGPRRAVDILAKIPTFEPLVIDPDEPPADACVGLVHLEIEGWDSISVMRKRMCDYRHYLSRKFKLPVLPLCIYMHVGMQGLGWDEYTETFHSEPINTFRYRYMGLPALDGVQYIQGRNLLGVALASMMKIADDLKAKAKADALQKIATSNEPEMRKYLLCECIETYLPLEEVQMKDYENLLVTPPYQGARKYGKTSFERGHEQGKVEGKLEGQLKLLREQLVIRFGPLNEETSKRLEASSEAQMLEIGKLLLTVKSLRELGLEP